MSDPAGEQWLDEHMARGEKLIWAFYVLAGLSAIGWRCGGRRATSSATMVAALVVLACARSASADYISYAGGHVRHKRIPF